MVLDCHIHIGDRLDEKQDFRQNQKRAGVDGGIILSYSPAAFTGRSPEAKDAEKRIAQVMDFTSGNENLYPFYFIDPTEKDALSQVDLAVSSGIRGFKVICGHHYPQDDRAMPVYAKIAKTGKPLLFHSGILYNAGPSGDFNRPCNFEHLFWIDGLRFALAHVSWPWHDELIAVFGKWNNFKNEKEGGVTASMYIDLTPGTPPIYREEVLTKLLRVGYEGIESRMIFGTDCTSAYDSAYSASIIERDNGIYDKLGLSKEKREKIFGGNLMSFLNG